MALLRTGCNNPADMRLLLTPQEAADALGIGRTLLYSLLMRKEIASVKVGAARRIPLRELEVFVDRLSKQEKAG